MTARSLVAIVLLPLLLVLAGCGTKKTASASLSGKVTLNGEPVPGGRLAFFSDTGSYSAVINAQGNYELADIPPGDYTVTVDNEYLDPNKKTPVYTGGQTSGPQMPMAKGGGDLAAKYGGAMSAPSGVPNGQAYKGKAPDASPVPEGAQIAGEGSYVPIPSVYKKKDTSTLKIKVEPGSNKKDIELTGK